MKQQYDEGAVTAPGTVIVSAAGHCAISKVVTPRWPTETGGDIFYIGYQRPFPPWRIFLYKLMLP